MIEYVAIGSLFKNNIHFEDGSTMNNIIGGGGFFAYAGLLQYNENSIIISEIGNDWEEFLGDWAKRNKMKTKGFIYYDNPTILSTLYYEEDGKWHENFEYGPDNKGFMPEYKNDEKLEIMREISKAGDVKGVYVGNAISNKIFLDKLYEIKKENGFKIMLELIPNDCIAENLDFIKTEMLPLIDIYSLNHHESYNLFSVKTQEDAIEKIVEIGIPCFYRVGRRGSYMIMDGQVEFMPSAFEIVKDNEKDPTGCGNNSTAASLWAFCEGYNAKEISSIANTSAAYNVQQYGPYHTFNEETRKNSLESALKLAKEYNRES